jgi:phosphoglycerate dehydrogenase-like enzyme
MTTPVEVLITLPISEDLLEELRGISPRLKINMSRARQPEDIPSEVWKRTEILYTDNVLPHPEQAPNLRWIQFHWAGIDHATEHPIFRNDEIIVTTASGAIATKSAEFALMMMLALAQRLPDLLANQQKGEWPRDRWERFKPVEIRDATVGIVGYGSIGRQIARLLISLGATVLACKRDPMHPEDTGYTPEDLGDPNGDLVHRLYPSQAVKSMMKKCDFIVVTVPLTSETRKMIGAEELAVLKPTAYLVDISRGGVIDSNALLSALRDRKIAGAALDVHAEEPLPHDSPFWKLNNVIITPHLSGITPHYNERVIALFEENLNRYLAGAHLYNLFDREKGY